VTIVLKCRKTGLFLEEPGQLTARFDETMKFVNGIEAQTFCRDNHLGEFDIEYRFNDSQMDFKIEVQRC